MSDTAGLTSVEQRALDVSAAVYQAVRHADVLDDRSHWERFANRLQSAAFAQSPAAFVEQVGRRFGLAHTPGDPIVMLLGADRSEARRVLRTIRQESNALSVLVRDQRDQQRKGRGG